MWTVLGILVVIGLGLVACCRTTLAGVGEPWRRRPWPARRLRSSDTTAGQARSQWKGQPLGRGPYTAAQAVPNAEFASQLASVARELRDAAASESWTVDWSRFNAQMDLGAAASQGGDFPQAVRQYCQSISFLMAELKRQRRAAGSGRH